MHREETVRRYYVALDEGDYEALADLLSPGFTHDRPDMTLEGRERFVRFMREERPQTDTSHETAAVYATRADELAVRGRLLDGGGEPIVRFVDVFRFDGTTIAGLDTYTQ